jgi:hypothetical protein
VLPPVPRIYQTIHAHQEARRLNPDLSGFLFEALHKALKAAQAA